MNKPQSIFFLSAIFATAAFILSWIGYIRCHFITFIDTTGTMSLNFGIFYHQSFTYDGSMIYGSKEFPLYGSCSQYPGHIDTDASWKASQAFTVLALMFGTVFLVLNMGAISFRPDHAKSIIGPGFMLTTLFQGLSLLFLNSNACNDNIMVKELSDASSPIKDTHFQDTCTISSGAKCIISATVLFFLASVTSCSARAAERIEEERTVNNETDSLRDPFLVREQSIFFTHP